MERKATGDLEGWGLLFPCSKVSLSSLYGTTWGPSPSSAMSGNQAHEGGYDTVITTTTIPTTFRTWSLPSQDVGGESSEWSFTTEQPSLPLAPGSD